MTKKKVVIVGNCQARPIAKLLDKMSDEIVVTKIAIVHLLKSEQEDEYKSFFEEADYIIAQLVNDNYPCKFVRTEYLKEKYRDKVTTIVNLFFKGGHPEWVGLKTSAGNPVKGPLETYHNEIIYACWKNKVPRYKVEEVLLDPESYSSYLNVGSNSLKLLVEKEVDADVLISDFLMLDNNQFWIFNHPKTSLILEYTQRIFNYIFPDIKPEYNNELTTEYLDLVKVPSFSNLIQNNEQYHGFEVSFDGVRLDCKKEYTLNDLIKAFYLAYDLQKEGLIDVDSVDITNFINSEEDFTEYECHSILNDLLKLNYFDKASVVASFIRKKFGDSNVLKATAKINKLSLNMFSNDKIIKDILKLNLSTNNLVTDFESRTCDAYIVKNFSSDGVSKLDFSLFDSSHYIFKNNVHPRSERKTYELINGTLSIERTKNYQYEYYFFDEFGYYLKDLSFGGNPFVVKDGLFYLKSNAAFVEDKFTKFNICHLLFDKIPRIFQFYEHNFDEVILFSDNSYVSSLAKNLGIKLTNLSLLNGNKLSIRFEKLILSSSSGTDHRHPGQHCNLDFHRFIDVLQTTISPNDESPKRFFIDRSDGPSRNILNAANLYELLREFNIVPIKMELLNFEEQCSVFYNAELIIGVHGAGLAHSVLAKSSTNVIEILPPLCATKSFWMPILSRNINYHSFIADDEDGVVPDYSSWQHNPQKYNRRNVKVDIIKFRTLLENIL